MIREGQYLEFTERLDDSFSLRVVINYEKHEYFNNMLGYFVEILLMKDGKVLQEQDFFDNYSFLMQLGLLK